LEVEFTDTALNDYLRSRHAKYDPVVRFAPDQVQVKMTYQLLGAPVPITALGHLSIEDGKRLVFHAEHVDQSLINQPGFGERFVEDRINPLLDLGRIEFPAHLDGVQVFAGRLKAIGAANIPREGDN
jgi:hypothetical protein